jgi:hypothetical protein
MVEQTIPMQGTPTTTEQKKHEKREYKLSKPIVYDNVRFVVLKLVLGFIIYMAIINLLNYNQYGILTPRDLLINPVLNLFRANPVAWVILVICELIGWLFFESNER